MKSFSDRQQLADSTKHNTSPPFSLLSFEYLWNVIHKYRNIFGFEPQTSYFWRTTAKHEIDYIEECDGHLSAFEFKWNPHKKTALPTAFARSYPDVEFKVVTRDNYFEFLS